MVDVEDKMRQDLLGSLRKRTAPLCIVLWEHPPIKNLTFVRFLNGGRDRDRTDDLLVANEALSQLSYTPENRQQHYFQHIYYSIYGNKNKNIFIFSRRKTPRALAALENIIFYYYTIIYV